MNKKKTSGAKKIHQDGDRFGLRIFPEAGVRWVVLMFLNKKILIFIFAKM